jgi:hypothetical protein
MVFSSIFAMVAQVFQKRFIQNYLSLFLQPKELEKEPDLVFPSLEAL